MVSIVQGSSVTLNTSNFDLFAFNFDNTEADVNLANSTNGTALLDGLNSASASATLNTSSKGGRGYIVAYDNSNAYLYSFNAGGNSTVSATEIALIGILDSNNSDRGWHGYKHELQPRLEGCCRQEPPGAA